MHARQSMRMQTQEWKTKLYPIPLPSLCGPDVPLPQQCHALQREGDLHLIVAVQGMACQGDLRLSMDRDWRGLQ